MLFSAYSSAAGHEPATEILVLKTRERKTIHREGSFGRYLATSDGGGYLVYMHEGTMFAAPFDLRQLALVGAPQPVLEDVSLSGIGGGYNFDFSKTGTLVYMSWKGFYPESMSMFWLDAAGRNQPLHSPQGFYHSLRFSPDGRRLAFVSAPRPQASDIWVKNLESGATSRVTSLPGMSAWPTWTPDGNNIVFESRYSPAPGIYWTRADGSGEAHALTDDKAKAMLHPQSFSPDSKVLAYTREAGYGGRGEIWTAPVEGASDHLRLGSPVLFLQAPVFLSQVAFSPDGDWLAYTESESGRQEVYVRPFPRQESARSGRSQISTAGGRLPIWAPRVIGAGGELFFLGLDRRIMVTSYTTSRDSFSVSKPRVWSEKTLAFTLGFYSYALAPDGKRFAAALYPGATGELEQKPSDSVTVLLNFFDELKRRVPVNK